MFSTLSESFTKPVPHRLSSDVSALRTVQFSPATDGTIHCMPNDRWESIYKVVRRIPRGRVATYGQVAELAGLEGHARQVGYALHALPSGIAIPWHRVVNARGAASPRSRGDSHELQRELLESEGVTFDRRGRLELAKYRWKRLRST